jgi:hypothetical protein
VSNNSVVLLFVQVIMLSMTVVLTAVRIGNKAQFAEFRRQIKWYQDKCEAMEQGNTPVLDLIGAEPTQPDAAGRPAHPYAIVERCRNSLSAFKQYIGEACEYVGAHIQGVVRSHYPGVDLRRLAAGVAENTSEERAEDLRDSSLETAKTMVSDVNLV